MPILDVAQKTSQERWAIQTVAREGGGRSVLAARQHDDDDKEDIYIYIYISRRQNRWIMKIHDRKHQKTQGRTLQMIIGSLPKEFSLSLFFFRFLSQSFCLSLPVCLFLSLCFCPRLSFCCSLYLYLFFFVSFSVFLSVAVSLSLSLFLSLCFYLYLISCRSLSLSPWFCLCLSFCLSPNLHHWISIYIYIYK